MTKRRCIHCGSSKRELRPYGPRGADVCFPCVMGYDATPARDTFGELWSEIYGAESWERNDWVWVYEFERKEAPR